MKENKNMNTKEESYKSKPNTIAELNGGNQLVAQRSVQMSNDYFLYVIQGV